MYELLGLLVLLLGDLAWLYCFTFEIHIASCKLRTLSLRSPMFLLCLQYFMSISTTSLSLSEKRNHFAYDVSGKIPGNKPSSQNSSERVLLPLLKTIPKYPCVQTGCVRLQASSPSLPNSKKLPPYITSNKEKERSPGSLYPNTKNDIGEMSTGQNDAADFVE